MDAASPAVGHILVVDDDVNVRTMVAHVLEDTGYNVTTANDGQEAIASVNETMPDLVISDIMMPNMDGIELFNTLRANPQTRAVPVVMMTSLTPEHVTQHNKIEPASILVKPFQITALLDTIAQLT